MRNLPQATLAFGSCFKWASRMASLIWSQILSKEDENKKNIHFDCLVLVSILEVQYYQVCVLCRVNN